MTNRKNWKAALSVGFSAMTAETLAELANAGITEIELSCGQLAPFFDDIDYPNRSADISRLAKDNGVNISSVHLPFAPFGKIDPASLDADVRAYVVKVQSELIRAAGAAGVGIAVIHPSGEPYKDEERAQRIEVASDVIAQLVDVAAESGVTIALENIPRTCLCRTHDEMQTFLDKIPDLRVCFDTNHLLGEKISDFIAKVGGKIITTHVSDYDEKNERHWLSGEGVRD
ncbi:MAG: sugar phosphate isomerase/epimerase, partial [Clostridia bacterium]|nr:sugar phosphate isomerase/epimerase [Clostridia bacterium]